MITQTPRSNLATRESSGPSIHQLHSLARIHIVQVISDLRLTAIDIFIFLEEFAPKEFAP